MARRAGKQRDVRALVRTALPQAQNSPARANGSIVVRVSHRALLRSVAMTVSSVRHTDCVLLSAESKQRAAAGHVCRVHASPRQER